MWGYEMAALPPVPEVEGPRAEFKQELQNLEELCPSSHEWRNTFRLDRESVAFPSMGDANKKLMTN